MPTIRIKRKKEIFFKPRGVDVYLDGEKIGNLGWGKSQDFEVPVGQHKLKAKRMLEGSGEFDFTLFNKEIRTFTISTNLRMLIPVLFFLVISFLLGFFSEKSFEESPRDQIIYFVMIAALLVYFFLVGRKSHWLIREEGNE